jgi:hypothetical protein
LVSIGIKYLPLTGTASFRRPTGFSNSEGRTLDGNFNPELCNYRFVHEISMKKWKK